MHAFGPPAEQNPALIVFDNGNSDMNGIRAEGRGPREEP